MDVTAEIPVIMLTDLSFMQENGALLLPSDLKTQHPAFAGSLFPTILSLLCAPATPAPSVAPEHGQANSRSKAFASIAPSVWTPLGRQLHLGLPLPSFSNTHVSPAEKGPLNTVLCLLSRSVVSDSL